jgi:lysophospholipase L1-like esterase
MTGGPEEMDDRRPYGSSESAAPGERQDEAAPFGRRRRTAASALVAMLVALALGALFNAPAMKKTALEMPFGGERSFRLALVDPLATVSHWLLLDRPAKLTADALGKPDPGQIGGGDVVVVTPTPKPSGKGEKPAKTLQEKPLPAPYRGHPMHLYIAGDSMMGLPGMALTNLSNQTKLIKPLLDYRISTGLVRQDFFSWPARFQSQTKAFDPGAAVVMFGANDNQPLQSSSGRIHQFGSDGWKKEYRKRVEDAIAVLYQGGVRRLYWIGQPVMPGSTFNGQIRLMNGIYRSVAEKTFGARYIDAYKLLSDRSGQHAQYLRDADGRLHKVREADGEHLTYAGGLIVAEAVMAAIKEEWFAPRTEAGASSPKASATASPAP